MEQDISVKAADCGDIRLALAVCGQNSLPYCVFEDACPADIVCQVIKRPA